MANKGNLSNGILASPVADTDTTATLESGQGSRMPTVPFFLTVTPERELSTRDNSEIWDVTDVTGDVLTITRAQKGTTALDFDAGTIVANGIYVEDLAISKLEDEGIEVVATRSDSDFDSGVLYHDPTDPTAFINNAFPDAFGIYGNTGVDGSGTWDRGIAFGDNSLAPDDANIYTPAGGVVRHNGEQLALVSYVDDEVSAINTELSTKEDDAIEVTVTTANATATKVGTTTLGSYSPAYGDRINVNFTSGCNANNPTLNIDGSGAKNIRLGNVNITTSLLGIAAAIRVPMWYDGTYWQIYGSFHNTNTTYTEITEANIEDTASSTAGLITGRRAEALMDNEASKARTLINKIMDAATSTFNGLIKSTTTNRLTVASSAPSSPATGDIWVDTNDLPETLAPTSIVWKETPGGTVDGTNDDFTTSQAYISGSLQLFINGIAQSGMVSEDAAASGTFSITPAPLTGDNLSVQYQVRTTATGNADTVDGYHANATPTANHVPVLDADGKMDISTTPALHMVALNHSSVQSIGNAAYAPVNMQTEIEKVGTSLSHTGTSPNVIVNDDGYYSISSSMRMAAATSGRSLFIISRNNDTAQQLTSASVVNNGSSGAGINSSVEAVFLEAGDTIQVQVFQDSGGPLNTSVNSIGITHNLVVRRIA